MALLNGRIPVALLTKVKSQPSLRLRSGAAASFERVRAEVKSKYGWSPYLNDAYRSISRQGDFIRKYYQRSYRPGMTISNGGLRYYQGVAWYRKPNMPSAATPGYSNHGLGLAIDVSGLGGADSTRYKQFASVARKHGWSNAEGARIGEAWHWVFTGNASAGAGSSSSGGAKRKPHRMLTLKQGRIGTNGWRTRLWQGFLKEHEYYKGKIDGKFGASTKAATKSFQRAHKLTPDGIVGRKTWFTSILGTKPGSRGYDVRIAQRILGLTGKKVDGVAGSTYKTRAKEMQRWLGVKADANLGAGTIAALKRKG